MRFSRDNFLNFSFFSYPRGFQHRLAAYIAASEGKPSGYGEENQRKVLGSLATTGKKMVGVLRRSSLQNRKFHKICGTFSKNIDPLFMTSHWIFEEQIYIQDIGTLECKTRFLVFA